MALVAGTSAESKKTVGKCNITHRFGGPRRAEKNLPLPRSSGPGRARSRRSRRLTWTRAYACGAVRTSDPRRRPTHRVASRRWKRDWPSVIRGGSCHGQRQQQPSRSTPGVREPRRRHRGRETRRADNDRGGGHCIAVSTSNPACTLCTLGPLSRHASPRRRRNIAAVAFSPPSRQPTPSAGRVHYPLRGTRTHRVRCRFPPPFRGGSAEEIFEYPATRSRPRASGMPLTLAAIPRSIGVLSFGVSRSETEARCEVPVAGPLLQRLLRYYLGAT